MSDKVSKGSYLSITLKFPIRTFTLLAVLWGLILLVSLIFFASPISETTFYTKAWLVALLLLLAFVHLYLQKRHWELLQQLIWNEEEWFLIRNNSKKRIKLTTETRVFKFWVLLCYQEQSLFTKQLWLTKDMTSDSDYRNLSRTLRFLTRVKKQNTNL